MRAPGRLVALRRHPVKGFTPERLEAAVLTAGAPFPGDRLWAVENGPSGFDPAAPAHISKTRFTVLAQVPAVARARTRWDEATGVWSVEAEGREPFLGKLDDAGGRAAFAAWLDGFLRAADPEAVRGPLRVLSAPSHRFFDSRHGHVSVLNAESVRDLGLKVGATLEPERFRANLLVEGWPAWSELEPAEGARLRIGGAVLRVVKPTVRCVAIHVDPATGERDLDLVASLREHYGHVFCGLYMQVAESGEVRAGDAAVWEEDA